MEIGDEDQGKRPGGVSARRDRSLRAADRCGRIGVVIAVKDLRGTANAVRIRVQWPDGSLDEGRDAALFEVVLSTGAVD